MTPAELAEATVSNLGFTPNGEQFALINALASYVLIRSPRDVFILNGYAGTGKTSVIAALVKAMKAASINRIILAPTGRAAKVAASMASEKAFTIHKRIFRGNSADPSNTTFFIAENRNPDTVFIIDEASLVTDSSNPRISLLRQLLHHISSAPGCAMIFVGDLAQLPPVGMSESPAMNPDTFRKLDYNPITFTLDIPVRQSSGSGILFNATLVRQFLLSGLPPENFTMLTDGFPDVKAIPSSELADCLSDSWSTVGMEETLIVTRSNKRANNYNKAIRNMVMYAEEPLQQGDRIVIAKNDYFWSKANKLESFIANGETADILWVGKLEKAYGRWFADVELKFPDAPRPVAAKIMLRSLMADGSGIPRDEMERFYNRVLGETEGELSFKIKAALENPFYNALQAKYAYCVTCHKAQGGQWRHVYVDLAGIPTEAIGPDFYRWLYTAITRASEKLFLINPGRLIDGDTSFEV